MADVPAPDRQRPARSLIIATAGHVDHGKTSLVNRITGIDTDTLKEEKARGLTINLGYAYYHFQASVAGEESDCTLGFVDVPGHTDFINNMLAGVGSVEFALLVIAADDGIMPQTREHLAILDLLKVSRGAVALTKIDRCDGERLDQVEAEVRKLLGTTELVTAPVFRVSNETGEGIEELLDHLQQALVEKTKDIARQQDFGFRYLADRSFTVKGIGTVVTGCVWSGSAAVDDQVLCTGNRQQYRIRGLRLDQREISTARAGERAAVNIAINLSEVKRGDWLMTPQNFHPVQRFDARLSLIDPQFRLRNSAQYHLYLGASHHIVTIRRLDEEEPGLYQVKSHDSMLAHHGDRFIIRDPAASTTIGGGKVIDIFVPRRHRGSSARLAALAAMDQEAEAALGDLLELLAEGVDLEPFQVSRNLSAEKLDALLETLRQQQPYVALAIEKRRLPLLLHEKYLSSCAESIQAGLKDYHASHGNQQGLAEPALSRALDFQGSHYLFHGIIQELIKRQVIARTGTLLHLPGHETSLSREEQEFLDKIRPLLIEAGNVPPRTRELVELTGIPLKPLERILRETTRSGSLIRVADNRHYLPETVMALAEFTEQLASGQADGEGFSVIQFRDASGIGRNLCIEILEYFDRVGFTRRDGNSRFVRTDKANIFGA